MSHLLPRKRNKMLYDEYANAVSVYKSLYGKKILVVFEVGSFYEWYNCDRNEGCDVQGICELLNIVKTRKDKKVCHVSRKNPEFGGVPNYAFPKFVPVLLEHGYTIVIYTQKVNEEGNITRSLEQVISRGTCVDFCSRGERESCDVQDSSGGGGGGGGDRYAACIYLDSHPHVVDSITRRKVEILHCGCALVNVTSGVTIAHEINSRSEDPAFAIDEIHRIVREYQPVETVLYGKASAILEYNDDSSHSRYINDDNNTIRHRTINNGSSKCKLQNFLRKVCLDSNNGVFDRLDGTDGQRISSLKFQESVLRKIFPQDQIGMLSPIEAIDMENTPHACAAFVGLMQFVFEHNEHVLMNILRPVVITYGDGDYEVSNESQVHMDPTIRGRGNDNTRALLNYNAAEQLDIISSPAGGTSLCRVLNSCVTSMGRRYFKHQLLHPLVNVAHIEYRLDEVTYFVEVGETRLTSLRNSIRRVGDLERVFRRLAMRKLSPLDFTSIDTGLRILYTRLNNDHDRHSLDLLHDISELISRVRSSYDGVIRTWCSDSSVNVDEKNTTAFLESETEDDKDGVVNATLSSDLSNDNGPFDQYDTVFHEGVIPELDETMKEVSRKREKMERINQAMNSLMSSNGGIKKENEGRTVFFRIEKTTVSSASTSTVGSYVITGTLTRCNTLCQNIRSKKPPAVLLGPDDSEPFDFGLVSCESLNKNTSYVSHPELIHLDVSIRNMESEIRTEVQRKYAQFLKDTWVVHGAHMTSLARRICHLDYVTTCAENAKKYHHVRPRLLLRGMNTNTEKKTRSVASAKGLRHPILEILHDRVPHVCNDIQVGHDPDSVGVLVYGMNAAGKSCLMKAVALAVIMTQAGMFAAAAEFELVPFTKFFTRIHTHDDLSRGQSTFMVEVSELRNILKRCDANSLVIGDEICAGTESVSALSIVGSSIRRLLERNIPFLFATHLHELPRALQSIHTDTRKLRVCHLRVDYDARSGRLVYNRKLQQGQGPTVYGLEVCRALDMDPEFIDTAHLIRKNLIASTSASASSSVRILGAAKVSRYNSRVLIDNCGICGNENRAEEVHHIRFQKEADNNGIIENRYHKNAAFNLIPLCRVCHDLVHEEKLKIYGFVQTSEGVSVNYERL